MCSYTHIGHQYAEVMMCLLQTVAISCKQSSFPCPTYDTWWWQYLRTQACKGQSLTWCCDLPERCHWKHPPAGTLFVHHWPDAWQTRWVVRCRHWAWQRQSLRTESLQINRGLSLTIYYTLSQVSGLTDKGWLYAKVVHGTGRLIIYWWSSCAEIHATVHCQTYQ